MSLSRPVLLLAAALALSIPAQTQQTPTTIQRDPQALAVLSQSLNAAGSIATLSAIQDFTASGTVTYFWAGEEVKGSVNLRGRGTGQFRLDAGIPDGLRSWTVSNGSGSLKQADRSIRPIPYHDAMNLGSLTFPFSGIVAALQQPSAFSISDLGIVEVDGRKARQIRIQQYFDTATDPDGTFTKLSTRDFYLDPDSFQLLKLQQMTHPTDTFLEDYTKEILYSDYRSVNGALVPFAITERIAGQRTWTIQLNQIQFNQGLSDSDFAVMNSDAGLVPNWPSTAGRMRWPLK